MEWGVGHCVWVGVGVSLFSTQIHWLREEGGGC